MIFFGINKEIMHWLNTYKKKELIKQSQKKKKKVKWIVITKKEQHISENFQSQSFRMNLKA